MDLVRARLAIMHIMCRLGRIAWIGDFAIDDVFLCAGRELWTRRVGPTSMAKLEAAAHAAGVTIGELILQECTLNGSSSPVRLHYRSFRAHGLAFNLLLVVSELRGQDSL